MDGHVGNLFPSSGADEISFGTDYPCPLSAVPWRLPDMRPDADLDRTESDDELQSYRYTIELGAQIPWSGDAGGARIRFNRRWSELTGAPALASVEDWANVLHPEDRGSVCCNWDRSLRTGQPLDHEHRLKMRDGSYRWYRSRAAAQRDADGAVLRWYGTTEDIHERKVSELQFQWLAHHDPLTGLGNRTLFQKQLGEALKHAAHAGSEVALFVLDLDGFKQVNDQLGHDAGDKLLAAFAQRMKPVMPTISRIGGDEFAVLLPSLASHDMIQSIFETVREALRAPLAGEFPHGCAVSIGCAIYPVHGSDPSELLKSADIALYEAKGSQPDRARIFESAMRRRLQQRSSMLSLAKHALEMDLVVPFYQPKVNLTTHKVEGFEALLRWHHPRLGYQLPATIDGAFQHPDLSLALGNRMMEQILADMRKWLDEGVAFGRIAVNVASPEFSRNDYAERVLERLDEAGVPAQCLEIEVTETVFLGVNGEAVGGALRTLSDAGITIALDDFGTGYASLSHLQKFPVDVLKIDRSFITALSDHRSNRAIVNAVVGLARSLSIDTVAEGIEAWDQAERLQSYGCGQGQGYLFGRPAPAADVPKILAQAPAAA
ncbi:MAG: hypothetical protein QOH81_1342 [Sphingomonadales bacterium]|nr:hypothetical protein [Sphingomonadales bacterium]